MALLYENALSPNVWALKAVGGKLPFKLQSSAREILGHVIGDVEIVSMDVKLTDDPQWELYPEIGECVKSVTGEETSVCVAIYGETGAWAIGVAGKYKVREATAYLALAAALAAELEPEGFQTFAEKWPALAAACESAGAIPEGYVPQKPRPAVGAAAEPAASGPAAKRPRRSGSEEAPKRQPPARAAAPAPPPPSDTLPRDVAMWIEVPENVERHKAIQNLPEEALVVSADGKTRKGLYSRADEAIKRLLPVLGVGDEELDTAVEYVDDTDWTKFPAVGEALKRIAPVEECLGVASCPAVGLWGVGVCGKSKFRIAAAKLALATSMALACIDAKLPMQIEDLTTFAEFVEESRRAQLGDDARSERSPSDA